MERITYQQFCINPPNIPRKKLQHHCNAKQSNKGKMSPFYCCTNVAKSVFRKKLTNKSKRKSSDFQHLSQISELFLWQGKKASNPRPTVLETAALPAELFPCIQFKTWWTVRDSNPGPTGYEPAALPTELTVQAQIW